ncbi:MAG: hypothetical protein KDI17_14825 [Halioglobus sp.]|nr:hypothetical protein [Halioglobus sp.]
MNIPLHRKPSPWRYLWLVAFIALPALGWYGILDELSAEDINASISNAGLIYGTARGINALVSLLQGTEFNVPFLTISIGEVLDPVNDLIERFSDFILLALGSLALQKILLAVVSETMFNILLTIVAVCSGLSMIAGDSRVTGALLRAFLVVAFFRFALGLVVLANSWVDARFLHEADQQRSVAMETFKGELHQINSLSRQAEEAAAEFSKTQASLQEIEEKKRAQERALRQVSGQIAAQEKLLQAAADEAGTVCRLSLSTPLLSPTCPASVKQLQRDIDQLESSQDSMEAKLSALDDAITEHLEKMDCLDNRSRGETCHFWEILPDTPNVTMLAGKLNAIETRVSDFAQNTINLLVSLLLKSIAIPLLFFLLLLKIIRTGWSKVG